jgi:hypothetical protein
VSSSTYPATSSLSPRAGGAAGDQPLPRPGFRGDRQDGADKTDETPSAEEKDLLVGELRRLARRHPEGVEEPSLRSAFIQELARRRELAGLPRLTPARHAEGFARALAALARRYPPPIEQKGDRWLPTARPKSKAAKRGGGAPLAAVPAGPGAGHRCRHCGEPVDWARPGGVAFADGGSAHVGCHERAAAVSARLARPLHPRRRRPDRP